jgi:ParB family chromosome partitioning protein
MAIQNSKSRLGRGLASLIGDNGGALATGAAGATGATKPAAAATPDKPANVNVAPATAAAASMVPEEGHRLLPIDMIKPSPLNPRKNFSPTELDELATSIKQRGLVQPLLVRPAGNGEEGYELVAGERRWRAAQQAGVHQVPVMVRSLADKEVLELAIIENVQRSDLNAIEEASGYNELIQRFGYSQDELARIMGKSRSHLTNMLRLLKLPESVQAMLREGVISAGHARALVGQADAEKLARKIVAKGLSVRQVEALVKDNASRKPVDHVMAVRDADTLAIEKELADTLGLAINIQKGKGQSGEIRIKYKTLDQFDDLYLRLMRKYS